MSLVLDFDGTITVKDTIASLADAAIAFQRTRRGTDLRPQWNLAVRAYLSDLACFTESFRPAERDRLDPASELGFLSALSGVENASLDRVERTGIFAGARREDLFRMGVEGAESGSIALREGAREMLRLAGQRGWRARILSVNWSRAFIEGVLRHHGVECAALGLVVLANEVELDGRICGPGVLGRRMVTAADKMECLALDAESAETGEGAGASQALGLYVGDSLADLGCLLRGRGGVVIADDQGSLLLRTLSRLGFEVPHVGEGVELELGGPNLAWARDLREVLESRMMSAADDVSSE